jgi:hypothetical protein
MKRNKVFAVGLATAAAASLVAATAVSASADPVRPYAAAGSDTIQDVWNGLSNDGAPLGTIASFDAFEGDGTGHLIKTKTLGTWFLRPSGSGNGIKALSAAWDPANHTWSGKQLTHEELDIARSSSGPKNVGTALTYIPFARDAVSVAFNPVGTLTSLNLTTNQIKEIYSGVDDTADSVVQISGSVVTVNGETVHPKIPQSASGTRTFFLGAIGVTTLASYISDPGTVAQGGLPENDGTYIANDGDLIPFSAAQWIAQNNLAPGVTNTTAGLALASVNGAAPTNGGASPAMGPGPLFGTAISGNYTVVPGTGAGVFNRDTYVVVPSEFRGGSATTKQTNLVNALSTAGATAIGGSASKAIIKQYGFGTLSYYSNSSNFKGATFEH